ncbi:hypothetical protein FisN_12Lh112 [Fistulifera solaris]|jgi:hypothetical protein|uniref:Uncharacterized protein n=1 Tax=Fistulifera solaris TaxID=1519565 RepID=A0A1Z5JMP8_FISSO|nr:hypothetical protein FisN_12Lh112 [Fistulifera solaris]|eukprot:GAX15186.1 hypothetical protein FisN_12Lh112 [Fistulifera solaris]
MSANEEVDHSTTVDMEFLDDGVVTNGDQNEDLAGDPAADVPSFTAEESKELQKHLNDQLEACMSNYRSKVKQFFKEFVVFHEVATQVVEQWKAPYENQLAEQTRLDAVGRDVEQTMKNIPWMNPNQDMKW